MSISHLSGSPPTDTSRIGAVLTTLRIALGVTALFALVAITPVSAQSGAEAFCETQMAETIKNVFTLIQFGGPLLGGVIALGATIALPMLSRSDVKLELKETRNQAIIWGIIVAPLGTAIVAFLLDNIVAGGASCGF
jgi:hypothetical protein